MVTKIDRMKNTLALHNHEGKKEITRKSNEAKKVFFRLLSRKEDFDSCPSLLLLLFLTNPRLERQQNSRVEPKDNEMKQIILLDLSIMKKLFLISNAKQTTANAKRRMEEESS
jgi:hypothetical protein